MKQPYGMPMYYGARPELFVFAKQMRHAPTDAEKRMWQIVNMAAFKPYKFRRQHPIGNFISDFYSHPLLLVIEIDGGYHLKPEQKEYDIIREEDIQSLGIAMLRFSNDEIISQPENSINKLKTAITSLIRKREKLPQDKPG